MYSGNTIWTQKIILRKLYVHTNTDIHTIAIDEEGSHEFEEE